MEVILCSKECTRCCPLNGGVCYREYSLREAIPYTIPSILFLSLLERFRCIPSLYIKLQFLELQVDLLLEFQRDLADNVSKVQSTPLSERFSAYLNATHYMVSLLQKWGEETVSLHSIVN